MDKQIPDIILEKYVLNELPGKKLKEMEKLINSSEFLKIRVEELKKSNRDILEKYPEDKMGEIINRKVALQSGKRKERADIFNFDFKQLISPVLTMAVAAVLLVVVIPLINPPDTRIKGDESKLYIYKKTGNIVEQIMNEDLVKKGDLLQVAYISMDSFGTVFSIDGRGVVTLHYPENSRKSTLIEPGKKNLLQNSYELDDAPLFERFFFITSKNEFNVEKILAEAEFLAMDVEKAATEKIDIPADYTQFSISVKKGE